MMIIASVGSVLAGLQQTPMMSKQQAVADQPTQSTPRAAYEQQMPAMGKQQAMIVEPIQQQFYGKPQAVYDPQPVGCPGGLLQCGQHCFNPVQYTCIQGVLQPEPFCPGGMLQCGQHCFNRLQYTCVGGLLYPEPVPQPILNQPIQQQFYGKQQQAVFAEAVLEEPIQQQFFGKQQQAVVEEPICPDTLSQCGDDCYNPDQYACEDDELFFIGDYCPEGETTLSPADLELSLTRLSHFLLDSYKLSNLDKTEQPS
jgi:hypothetical protein